MELVQLSMHGMTENPHHGMTHPSGTDHNHVTNHNHGAGTDMNHGDHMMGGHAMFFGFSLPIRVLFYEWNIVTQGQLAVSCAGVFLFGMLYEGLKVWRQNLLQKSKSAWKQTHSKYKDSDSDLKSSNARHWRSRCFSGWHLLQSFLHIVQTTFGMFLMLIYMTYNVWLAVSVSLGAGVGYFAFAWIIPTNPDFGEHCQ